MGRILELVCDDEAYADRFERAFRHSRTGDGDSGAAAATRLCFLRKAEGLPGAAALVCPASGRGRTFPSASVEPTQLYYTAAFVDEVLLPVTDRAVLHASVVQAEGRGVTVLAGRSHSGKTTLGLAVALMPEVAFLSDEFCPIRLEDGLAEPFPRALGLRPFARAVLERRGAIAPGAGDGELVDPGQEVKGLSLGTGGPVDAVVLVAGEGLKAPDPNVREVEVERVDDAMLADLRAINGVLSVVARPDAVAWGTTLALEVRSGALVTEAILSTLRDRHGVTTAGFLPPGARRPDFALPPRLTLVSPSDAIPELWRHLANGPALLERWGGSRARLVFELAGLLGSARFYSLRPGPLEATADLVLREVIGVGG